MKDRHVGRACITTTLLVALATTGTLLGAEPASATPTAQVVTCTSLAGNLTDAPITFTLGGCNGNTGGSGRATGNTVTWANGRTTGLTTDAFPLPSGQPRQGHCGQLSDKYAVKDSVYGDTTGSIKDGGKVSAEVCILNQAPDPWSLAPGSVFKLR